MFLVLEGPDGAGKTTQAGRLADALREDGHTVVQVREPGGTALGERVREVLLGAPGREAPPVRPRAELFLYLASRAQLTLEVIRPALARGDIVLADRFYASTAVYQGLTDRALSFERTLELCLEATGGLTPDLTVVLELDAPEAKARATRRGEDRRDARPLDYYARIAEGYRRYLDLAPEPVARVFAAGSPDDVFSAIWSCVRDRLAAASPTPSPSGGEER